MKMQCCCLPPKKVAWKRRHKKKAHLQSGFVGGGVVGQPTAVSQALHHLEAESRRNIQLV